MSVICRDFSLKPALRTSTFLKRSHASTLSIWMRKFPSTTLLGHEIVGAIKWRDFCVTSLGGLNLEELIHGGAYFWSFTVR